MTVCWQNRLFCIVLAPPRPHARVMHIMGL
jgi:hypothetical protein